MYSKLSILSLWNKKAKSFKRHGWFITLTAVKDVCFVCGELLGSKKNFSIMRGFLECLFWKRGRKIKNIKQLTHKQKNRMLWFVLLLRKLANIFLLWITCGLYILQLSYRLLLHSLQYNLLWFRARYIYSGIRSSFSGSSFIKCPPWQ